MRIKLSPQRRDDSLSVNKNGSVLTVNGEDFDFSQMPNGSTLPQGAIASEWFASDVDMLESGPVLTLRLPLPANYSQEQAFPVDLVDVPDGPVMFPQPLPESQAQAEAAQ